MTSESMGKARVCMALKEEMNYKRMVMIGDGMTDSEARPPAVSMVTELCSGRVQAEGDKLKTSKFGKLFELLITFEIVSQSQKSLVHSWVIVVRTGCHSQILLITPNLRLTAVFVTFREGSFAIITFDLEP